MSIPLLDSWITKAKNAEIRIRELEAEAKMHILDGMTQRARAEKAEAELVAELDARNIERESESKRRYALEARIAELEGVYEAEACPTCGVTQVTLWDTHQSVHKAREREE